MSHKYKTYLFKTAIRTTVQTELPHSPTFETFDDRISISEVEMKLRNHPDIKKCLDEKLWTTDVLHEKLLAALATQREAGKKHEEVNN
jgi:hypothetical protein